MQKKLMLAGVIAMLSLQLFSQNCKTYYFLQNNKTVEMTIYNKKGDPNGKNIYSITDVTAAGDATTGTLHSELFDKKGKSIAKGAGTIQCKGGILMVDAKMMLPAEQQEKFGNAAVKADNVYIEYPAVMNAGDQLKDANISMDVDNNGLKQTVTMTINNRKVEGKESVTTSAGTWDCYKISYTSKINIKTMGIGIPINVDGTEWFAPGFGIVKSESKHGGTAITSIK